MCIEPHRDWFEIGSRKQTKHHHSFGNRRARTFLRQLSALCTRSGGLLISRFKPTFLLRATVCTLLVSANLSWCDQDPDHASAKLPEPDHASANSPRRDDVRRGLFLCAAVRCMACGCVLVCETSLAVYSVLYRSSILVVVQNMVYPYHRSTESCVVIHDPPFTVLQPSWAPLLTISWSRRTVPGRTSGI